MYILRCPRPCNTRYFIDNSPLECRSPGNPFFVNFILFSLKSFLWSLSQCQGFTQCIVFGEQMKMRVVWPLFLQLGERERFGV